MGNKLSHSSVTKFQHCPTAWNLHYNKKIRPVRQHAALAFGTALDKATGALLNGENGYEVFDKFWRFQFINNVQTYIPTCIDIVYAESDFDKDLIEADKLAPFELTIDEIIQAVQYKEDKGYENIPDDIKKIVNVGNWLCLLRKGHLMLDAFNKEVMTKIVKVHSTQEMVSLENEEGDEITGFLDLVADINLNEQVNTVILDVKTSAREYKENSAIYSPQLTLYVNALGPKYNTRKAGFIVLSKQVSKNKKKICKTCKHDGSGGNHKTCPKEYPQMIANKKGVEVEKLVRCNGEWNESINPKIHVQIIVDEIPEATEELIMQNIEDINQAIKLGVYTKNLSSCLNSFSKPCDYLDLCYRGSMEGLVIKQEK